MPIPKPNDQGSYRAISLLSCVSKTMERMFPQPLQYMTCPLHPSEGKGTSECLSIVSTWKSTTVFLDPEKALELTEVIVILSLLADKGVKG